MVWLAILFFVGLGVYCIVDRKEMAQGIALSTGAAATPGCAVALAVMFFVIAAITVGLHFAGIL
jgi:hypothetical protein